MSMRGLTVFIADLRKCRARELEEKRINKEMANIRTKFRDGNLNGYQKKKYVCKLLYMYILGWDIDFGHTEAVNLMCSSKYSEKQIGYLAITLLLTENSDLARLVVNTLRKDLEDLNEIYNCLGLHAIANIGGREMAESLAGDVQRLLVSRNTKSFVKKKAALCLLRLFRKHPDVLPATDWADHILSIMDYPDLGVTLSLTSLITALAQQFPEAYQGCVEKAIHILYKIIVKREYSLEYVYYKVPIPWLQVKLLRLLQYYAPPEQPDLRNQLSGILQSIINNAHDVPKNIQHANAQNAILFEAINLAINLDIESDIVTQAASLLCRFISSKETNTRYLGLETMAHLASYSDSLDAIKKHQDIIILSLRDKDISVRRRALDLLYAMCDVTNAKTIVGELLRYLQVADYTLREEMALKIAILTEKFAADYEWYVDTMLQLISSAGDHISDEVWYRVVQIITNNENLQEYAVRSILHTLNQVNCHENALRIGGYVLGEFGHLVANEGGCSPIEQFRTLHSKFNMCSASTRALLLSTYLKFVNLFPEIKEEVLGVFYQYRHVLDVELQQRACEYLVLANFPDEELIQTVCEEMPPFQERESALMSRLQKKVGETEDKRTWSIAGKDTVREKKFGELNGATNGQQDLLDLFDNAPLQGAGSVVGPAGEVTVDADYENKYRTLIYTSEGVLYEDAEVQIGIKSEYHGHLGRIAIFLGNKSATHFTQLKVNVDSIAGLSVETTQQAPDSLAPYAQAQQLLSVECQNLFQESVGLQLAYQGSAMRALELKLPIVLNKFLEPVQMTGPDFFVRWKQIGGPPKESQVVFASKEPIDIEKVKRIAHGCQFGLLDGVDPNANNLVGVSVFNTSQAGKVGCLLRLEPSLEQQMYRLTIRTTNDLVTSQLRANLQTLLES
ncbi:putative alpha-adaptin C [Basidiobolus meristosporus CBS 931.73]|uniref:AP-2 complex subunit alpha n=1 Tax=Basidiobolus meristosporus CBS 931.73 TaxID=1314790 RepID=A0A1Y1YNC8_9FUNG|nr:putative alpha-adaptin C [Basidiobolus meristosporus CBS 931.73]|eukprot:ORX99519.1 putative alpha-adaptin C [Basidiobolus meristosporus CBS 931.73]